MTDVDEVYGGFRLDAQRLPDLLGWTPEEMALRRDLAAAYRLCARFGWDDLVYTHISARVPGPGHHFLVNPLGLGFDEITASNLIKIDLDGNIIGETVGAYAPNAAGFVIHGGIHQVRADAGCVMHLHTEAQMALSVLECGLLPLTQHAMRFYGRIGYHDYEGIALSKDERVRFIEDLGDHSALILRNHGTLTVGETVAQAFVEMFYLEQAAKSQLMAQATGLPLRDVPTEIIELTARQWRSQLNAGREWPALLRRLAAAGSTYAE